MGWSLLIHYSLSQIEKLGYFHWKNVRGEASRVLQQKKALGCSSGLSKWVGHY
jgi:hypothetical protein